MSNVIRGLPGFSGPQQDLPSAFLSPAEWLPIVGLGTDGVPMLRQLQALGVRLGEVDDVRVLMVNAELQLRCFPLGGGPLTS